VGRGLVLSMLEASVKTSVFYKKKFMKTVIKMDKHSELEALILTRKGIANYQLLLRQLIRGMLPLQECYCGDLTTS